MPFRAARKWLLLLVPAVLLAFWPNYFAAPSGAVLGVHVHALAALCWLLLLGAQLWSIHARRGHLHRRLGMALFAVVPLFVAGGLLAIQAMAVKTGAGHPFYRHTGPALGLADAIATPAFLALVALALVHRRSAHAHGAAMLATALLVLPPIFGRLLPAILWVVPGMSGFMPAFHVAEIGTALLALGLARSDCRHALPFVLVAVDCLLQSAAAPFASASAGWRSAFLGLVAVPRPALGLAGFAVGLAVLWLAWRAGSPRRQVPSAEAATPAAA